MLLIHHRDMVKRMWTCAGAPELRNRQRVTRRNRQYDADATHVGPPLHAGDAHGFTTFVGMRDRVHLASKAKQAEPPRSLHAPIFSNAKIITSSGTAAAEEMLLALASSASSTCASQRSGGPDARGMQNCAAGCPPL